MCVCVCVCTSGLAPLCRSRCCQCCWHCSFSLSLSLPATLPARRHIQSFNILCTVNYSQPSYSATDVQKTQIRNELTLPDRTHCIYVHNLHTLVFQHIHKLFMYVCLCVYIAAHSRTQRAEACFDVPLFVCSFVPLFVRSFVHSFARLLLPQSQRF